MFHLIYVSRSVKLLSELEMHELLEESRSRNRECQLTGMLLYLQDETLNPSQGRFIQVLEGNEADVLAVFGKIRNDPRHHHVSVVDEVTKAARDFDSWSMGFERLRGSEIQLAEGSFDLNGNFLKQGSPRKINTPLSFLRSFYSLKEGLLKKK